MAAGFAPILLRRTHVILIYQSNNNSPTAITEIAVVFFRRLNFIFARTARTKTPGVKGKRSEV
ncbi:hypothetical protein [Leptospira interrogans]|uniref:hypothetical protein n=1 Tax=Leptospira interrogans TaxID=173 RepID=UPI001582A70F|nr:hypothetical protein [Leptospira interrogans]